MKLLFLSRAFPPIRGGIENQNAALAKWLPKHTDVETIANRGGKKSLWWFLPYATVKLLFEMRQYDALLLGDGVLAPIGALIKLFYPKKAVVCIIHGLDITFATKKGFLASLYRIVNIPAIRSLDRIIAVSRETASVSTKAGIPAHKITVIPNGIETETFRRPHTREELEKILGKPLNKRPVVALFGRYVKRKGAEWFLREVMPLLPENVFFVAAGGRAKKGTPGDEDIYEKCVDAIADNHLYDRVLLLENVSDDVMEILRNTADIVVVPNIPVTGSMEGFGLVAIEAASAARPVVASAIEGLKDAIIDGENGVLVEPGNAEAFATAITQLLSDEYARHNLGERALAYTRAHYHWKNISGKYVEALESISSNQ